MSLWKRSEVSLNLTIEIVFLSDQQFWTGRSFVSRFCSLLDRKLLWERGQVVLCCQIGQRLFRKWFEVSWSTFWFLLRKDLSITVSIFNAPLQYCFLQKNVCLWKWLSFYSPTIVWKVADVLVSASLPLLLKQSFWKWSEGFIISFSALAAQKCLSENDLMACCWILVFFCSKVLFKTVGSFNAKVVVSSWSHMFSFFEMLWSVIAKFPASSILRFCWKCSEASLPNSFFLIKEYIIENCNAFHGQTVC